jgi:hypothetical protein
MEIQFFLILLLKNQFQAVDKTSTPQSGQSYLTGENQIHLREK